VPSPQAPMPVARLMVNRHHQAANQMALRHWRGAWMRWGRTCWFEIEERSVRAVAYRDLEHARYQHTDAKGNVEIKPWAPNRYKMADLLAALKAVTNLSETIHPPTWIDGAAGPDQIVACRNGLLDVHSRRLLKHDPRYFNLVAVPFDYNPDAPKPVRWLSFLTDLWPDDPDQINALQEIARVLTALIGKGNVTGPTLASLGTNFGPQDLIGKPLAIISDARLGGRDTNVVVERLLSISGEDTLTLDRKYRDPWTGQLPTRFFVISNELPPFGDPSGAIVHRFVLLTLDRSWLGQENTALTAELLSELPGILRWALDGPDRLAAQGCLTEPASSPEAIVALEDSASPVSAFVRDRY
jgi:putative DNA primase/helicase